jgi:crotonobetainyl-CoA:carnitine CoA-transferase CaiB-like acyl-CoA transferase
VPLTGRPADVPLHVGFSLADTSAGLMGCMAITMALLDRDRNGGRGARIDVGLYEPLLRMAELQAALWEQAQAAPQRTGSNDPYGWGADPQWGSGHGRRYVAAACRDDDELLVLVDPASAPALAALAGAAGAAENDADAFDAALRRWAGRLRIDDAGRQLRAAGIEAARIHDGRSLAESPYFLERGDVVMATDPTLGSLAVPGRLPLRHGGAGPDRAAANPFHAPRVGEHDNRVFGDRPLR